MKLSADTICRLHGETFFLKRKHHPVLTTPIGLRKAEHKQILVVIHGVNSIEDLHIQEKQVLQAFFPVENIDQVLFYPTDIASIPKEWLDKVSRGLVIFSSMAEWQVAGMKLSFPAGEMKQGKKLLASRWLSLKEMASSPTELARCVEKIRTSFFV